MAGVLCIVEVSAQAAFSLELSWPCCGVLLAKPSTSTHSTTLYVFILSYFMLIIIVVRLVESFRSRNVTSVLMSVSGVTHDCFVYVGFVYQ